MLYALLDRSHTIRKEHLTAALALWEYVEASARFIFGDAVGDPVADAIHRALTNSPDGLTRTEIRDLFGRNQNASAISRALGVLIGQGMAHSKKVKTDGRGRPGEKWFATDRTKASTT